MRVTLQGGEEPEPCDEYRVVPQRRNNPGKNGFLSQAGMSSTLVPPNAREYFWKAGIGIDRIQSPPPCLAAQFCIPMLRKPFDHVSGHPIHVQKTHL